MIVMDIKVLPTAAGTASAGHSATKTSADAATAEASSAVVVRGYDNPGDDVGDYFAHLTI